MDREDIFKYISPLSNKKTFDAKLPPLTKDKRTKDLAFPTHADVCVEFVGSLAC